MNARIIDLLSLKSKEIEQPYKIKYKGDTYFYDGYDYFSTKGYLFEKYNAITILNDEVEIIEEDKKIEKIKEYQMTYPEGGLREDEAGEQIETIVKKINEIIEVINGRD